MKLEHSLMPYTKIGSKWIEDLKVKFLEENIDRMLFDINCSNIFLDAIPRVMKIKTIINKWNLVELTQKLLYSKGNCKKKKIRRKPAPKMGENICKQCNRQGLYLQNVQAVHSAQSQKKQTTQSKNGQKI